VVAGWCCGGGSGVDVLLVAGQDRARSRGFVASKARVTLSRIPAPHLPD
jgi:hypothetical protein